MKLLAAEFFLTLAVLVWCSSLTGLQAAAVALWLAAVLLWLDRQYGRVR